MMMEEAQGGNRKTTSVAHYALQWQQEKSANVFMMK
jgi:hypothetical protein